MNKRKATSELNKGEQEPSFLRWAIFGTGFISNTVINAINLCAPNSSVCLIAGRNEDRVKAMQKKYGIPKSCCSYEVALVDSEVGTSPAVRFVLT